MRASRSLVCPFGRVLAAVREERGMTQGQLARKLGRSPQQISRMERGEREPMFSTIVFLAAALNMEPGELFRRAAEAMHGQADGDPGQTAGSDDA